MLLMQHLLKYFLQIKLKDQVQVEDEDEYEYEYKVKSANQCVNSNKCELISNVLWLIWCGEYGTVNMKLKLMNGNMVNVKKMKLVRFMVAV
jgi:hypothetical protein